MPIKKSPTPMRNIRNSFVRPFIDLHFFKLVPCSKRIITFETIESRPITQAAIVRENSLMISFPRSLLHSSDMSPQWTIPSNFLFNGIIIRFPPQMMLLEQFSSSDPSSQSSHRLQTLSYSVHLPISRVRHHLLMKMSNYWKEMICHKRLFLGAGHSND